MEEPQQPQTIELPDILTTTLKSWPLLLGLGTVGVIISILAYFQSDVWYEAEAVVGPSPRLAEQSNLTPGLGGVTELLSFTNLNLDQGFEYERALAVINSHQFLQDFIVENDLLADEFFVSSIDAPPHISEGSLLHVASEYFRTEVLSIRRNNNTGLATIAVRWTTPESARDWTNQIVKSVDNEMRRRAIVDLNQQVDYLADAAERETQSQIKEALYVFLESQLKKLTFARVSASFTLEVIDPAPIPFEPVAPRLFNYLFLGLFSGVLLFSLIVFCISAFSRFRHQ